MDRLGSLLVIGTLSVVLALGFYWGVPTHCVQLPNGLNIGKQALIDLNRPYFRPDIVPKFDNGQSLLPGDAWPFYATETTVHGLALEADPEDDFWFAWREDTGLVLKAEDPALYEKLVSEAGAQMGNKGINVVGSHMVMMQLQRRPEYANQTCRTRWIVVGTGHL
ncbi:hypothetical protein [Primorskyibacter sp. 2E233]|jgi:hypothetical protein|uniref:hypothetical protein n=1 Tax=Primorskyibacter sp. 2E233 TaxID=3413431 RepID=UPI003BF20DD3|tara:strand:- start:310 stop:804 length:495 start_codon:yes stop_codon:yes gene_type:complete